MAIPSTLPPQLGAEIVEELADTRMSPRGTNLELGQGVYC